MLTSSLKQELKEQVYVHIVYLHTTRKHIANNRSFQDIHADEVAIHTLFIDVNNNLGVSRENFSLCVS